MYLKTFLSIMSQVTVAVIILLSVGVGYFVFLPKYTQWHALEKRRDVLSREIALKEAEIRSLKSRQQRFKTDPDFVEVVARQSKRIRPNEILFVFEEPAPSVQ